MKIQRIFLALCGMLLTAHTVSAQQNMWMLDSKGNLSAKPISSVFYSTFNLDCSWFDVSITNEGIDAKTTNSISASCAISLTTINEIKYYPFTPEIGVCYSEENNMPTMDNECLYLGSTSQDYSFSIPSLIPGTTYYYRVYVKIADFVWYGDVVKEKTFGTKPVDDSRIINGHKFIDLGLPSGLLWAETNVGAETAVDDGGYYAWGETYTKDIYDENTYTYKFSNSAEDSILDLNDDAAYVNWGSSCRMPTYAEFEELFNSDICTWTWTNKINSAGDSINGYIVTSKVFDNSIFLPATSCRGVGVDTSSRWNGYYLSSSYSYNDNYFCGLAKINGSESGNTIEYYNSAFYYAGVAVRPVAAVSDANDNWFSITNSGIDTIKYTSVTASCQVNLLLDNTKTISPFEVGVCYSKGDSVPTVEGKCIVLGSEAKVYSFSLSSLVPASKYTYRVYVKSGDNVTYGGLVRVKTLGDDIVDDMLNVDDVWFTIINSVDSTTSTKVFASCAVNLIDSRQILSPVSEVGVCYCEGDSTPSIENRTLVLGTEVKDYSFTIPSLDPVTNYTYRIYVKSKGEVSYSRVAHVKTLAPEPVTINGHRFIDLGLPSGLLWAETNIGAETAADDGDYFAWAETESKSEYTEDTYKYLNGSQFTKYYNTTQKSEFDSEDDAAYVNWGSSCRIPTNAEFEEILNSDYCIHSWTTKTKSDGSRITGYEFTSVKNGNSIFLPASGFQCEGGLYDCNTVGCYWASTFFDASRAYYLRFDDWGYSTYDRRYYGYTVRPVATASDATFSIVNSINSITSSKVFVSCSIAILENDDRSLPSSIEVGVCYREGDSIPTVDNKCVTLGSEAKDYSFVLPSLEPATTYTCRVYVKTANNVYYSNVNRVKTPAPEPVTINGHKFIDLGLPSGLLWAETNIGATTDANDGDYFAWGETEAKLYYDWDAYKYGTSTSNVTKYNKTDGKTALDVEDDAAYVNWGSSCHMPTEADFAELCNSSNCTWTLISKTNSSGTNIDGCEITSVKNGNSIFLPASGFYYNGDLKDLSSDGYYLSSTLYTGNVAQAYNLRIYSGSHVVLGGYRNYGFSIRPVVAASDAMLSIDNSIDSITTSQVFASCSIDILKNDVQFLLTPIEVGVCYREGDSIPTVDNQCVTLGSEAKDYSFTLSSFEPATTFTYRVYVKTADNVYYSNVNHVKTLAPEPVIINGHKFIDLGLPSGLLWAETNIGATTEADDGDYFSWGETEAKSYYDWSTYKYSQNYKITKYNDSDGKTALDKEDDAAYVNWGALCRMPTDSEFEELLNSDNCTWFWVTKTDSSGSSINGYEVTSVKNGNSIFLPASGMRNSPYLDYHGSRGYYWSNMLSSSNSSYTDCLYFNKSSKSVSECGCIPGCTVRPVAEP